MANVIAELPKITRAGAGGKRGSKYPFDEWFDGQVRELVHGTTEEVEKGDADYSAKTSSVVNMLHTQGAARDFKVKTVKTEKGIAVVAFKIEEKAETPEKNGKGKTDK